MDATARNQFICKNYKTIETLCMVSVIKVRRCFPELTREDLMGHAMEGIVCAMKRADTASDTWKSYLSYYAYSYALSGAVEMLGKKRSRINGKDHRLNSPISYVDPVVLSKMSDDRVNSMPNEFDKIFIANEISWFIDILKDSIELHVLKELLSHMTLKQIADHHGISTFQVRRVAENLSRMYKLASGHMPFEHLYLVTKKVSDSYTERIYRMPCRTYRIKRVRAGWLGTKKERIPLRQNIFNERPPHSEDQLLEPVTQTPLRHHCPRRQTASPHTQESVIH